MNITITKRQQKNFYQKMVHRKTNETVPNDTNIRPNGDFEFVKNSTPKIWGYRF